MFNLYKNNFKAIERTEINRFILSILGIAENYIKFLISRNKIYLPVHIEPKDAAIDLIAELFTIENDILIRFKDFFNNNFTCGEIRNEEDFEKYLRGFIYTVIQNNLINFYRENDPITYHIHRNINEAVKNLNYFTSIHFSDKYLSPNPEFDINNVSLDKEELINFIYSNNLEKNIINMRLFIKSLFEELENSKDYPVCIRISDLVSAVKSILAIEFINKNGAATQKEHMAEKINIKFLLEDVRFNFNEKLNKYCSKNNLSKIFKEGMYNIIDEIIGDMNSGNKRKSVMELMRAHFKRNENSTFYKIQYCIELFEEEITKYVQKEQILIG